MARGGKREGAGRPKSEPTSTIRLPTAVATGARDVLELLRRQAQKSLEESVWWQTCPRDLRDGIVLALDGVEDVEIGSLMGSAKMVLAIAWTATEPTSGEFERVFLRI